MNKKLMLLLTFIVSFIVSTGVVSAAQELTCIYRKGSTQKPLKIVQSANGTLSFYYGNPYEDITSVIMGEKGTIENKNDGENTGYDPKTKILISCPQCANKNGKKVQFANFKSNGNCPRSFTAQDRDVTNTGWKQICHYKLNGRPEVSVTLYFNETNFKLTYDNKSNYVLSESGLNAYQIWNNNPDHNCPSVLYSEFISGSETEQGSTEQFTLKEKIRKYTNTSSEIIDDGGSEKEYPEINNCQELFGKDLMEIINKVMNIVRIVVPVLLLVYGTSDFFTAIFMKSDDNMKEHRDRFFKRLIAALIVFIVPIFVNLILKLANSVWSDIHSETCVNDQ